MVANWINGMELERDTEVNSRWRKKKVEIGRGHAREGSKSIYGSVGKLHDLE
jgi:hypothetical protein